MDADLLLSLGLHPDLNDWMGTHDSGQMVVHKEKGWDALMLASFMSLHAEAIYPMVRRPGRPLSRSLDLARRHAQGGFRPLPPPARSSR